MAFELESNLKDTLIQAENGLFSFNTGKTQLVSFDWLIKSGTIDVKCMVLFFKKNHLQENLSTARLDSGIGCVQNVLL